MIKSGAVNAVLPILDRRSHFAVRWLFRLAFALVSLTGASWVHAESYPAKPVVIVIPFSAGGSHDLNARAFTAVISKYLGQAMTVRLTPGAGGQKGAKEVAASKPDGYTLLFGHNLIDQLQAHTENLNYDPLTAFQAVWKLNDAVPVLYAAKDSRFETLKDLVDYGLQHPGEVVFPHSGKWGFSFTTAAMLMAKTGLRVKLVSYKGGGPVKAAILSGTGDFSSAPYGSVRGLHEAGRVRVMAVAAPERLAVIPEVPTLSELGIFIEGAVMERIIMAPRGTPEARIRVLQTAFEQLYRDEDFLALMNKMGENINYMDGANYESVRNRQSQGYKALVEQLLD